MLFKRIFDLFFSVAGILLLAPVLLILLVIAAVETHSSGLFLQQRIGQHGKVFTIYKIRSIHLVDLKISKIGGFLRTSKLDELPQLYNVLKGDMSFVGPRPDVAGYYDLLKGEDRKILNLKPGLTSEASLKYANEEEILNVQADPLHYNDTVIFPDKVAMNLHYYNHRTLWLDVIIIFKTIFKI